jgi:hypothetical protein
MPVLQSLSHCHPLTQSLCAGQWSMGKHELTHSTVSLLHCEIWSWPKDVAFILCSVDVCKVKHVKIYQFPYEMVFDTNVFSQGVNVLCSIQFRFAFGHMLHCDVVASKLCRFLEYSIIAFCYRYLNGFNGCR